MRIRSIELFFILCIFFSCGKKSESFLRILISPDSNLETKNSGDIIPFDLDIASNVQLSRLLVIETINNQTIDTILDRSLSGLEANESFNYVVPNISETNPSELKLLFKCMNVDGESQERAKIFSVNSSIIYLNETTGHDMYSASSSSFNAYDLLEGSPQYNSDSTVHITDNTDSSDILSREWSSPSGLEFVRHNSFDYANATIESLEDIYNSSLKNALISNISANDIIITLIEDVYVAIKVVYVIDDLGVENDKYIFNIKY